MIHNAGRKYRYLCSAIAAVLILFPFRVWAADATCSATIPFESIMQGNPIEQTASKIILEAEQEGAPLPNQTEIVLKKAGKGEFGPITYTTPGDYRYKVYQKAEDKEYFAYDSTVYTVTVRILNGEEGGLKAEIWAIKEKNQNKADSIKFTNRYQKPDTGGKTNGITTGGKTSMPVKTGDESDRLFWVGMFALSGTLTIWSSAKIKRKPQEPLKGMR